MPSFFPRHFSEIVEKGTPDVDHIASNTSGLISNTNKIVKSASLGYGLTLAAVSLIDGILYKNSKLQALFAVGSLMGGCWKYELLHMGVYYHTSSRSSL